MESEKEPGIFLEDLYEFPEGSLPSPVQMMNPVRRLQSGLRLVAVGWLHGPIEFAKGATHPDVVSKLLSLGDEFVISEGTRGFHTCFYCGPEVVSATRGYGGEYRPESPLSHGHHLVRSGDVVYVCPALLPHYVVVHGYRPPDVFQEAVRHGEFLTDRDLIHTGEDFLIAALQPLLAAAEQAGDGERADALRTRLSARRAQLQIERGTPYSRFWAWLRWPWRG